MEERQVTADGVTARAARPVPRRGDAEPDRARGHLPAARGAARPLPAEAPHRRPGARRRDRRAAPARRGLRPARARRGSPPVVSTLPSCPPRAAGRGIRRRLRRRPRLHRRPRPRDAAEPVGAARREPARRDLAARGREGLGVAQRIPGASRPTTCRRCSCPTLAAPHPAAARGGARGRLRRRDPALPWCSRRPFRSDVPDRPSPAPRRPRRRARRAALARRRPGVARGAGLARAVRGPRGSGCGWPPPSPRALELSRDLPRAHAPRRARRGAAALCATAGRGAPRPAARCLAALPPARRSSRIRIDLPAGERRTYTRALLPRAARRAAQRVRASCARPGRSVSPAARRSLAAPGALRVLPPFTARRHLPSRLARLRELDGSTSVQVRGAGTEFDSLREYVRGDDVRSIDWRATARRRDDRCSRTWRPERDRHVVIVIDTGRTAAARVGDERAARRRLRGDAAARRARTARRRPCARPPVRPRAPRAGQPRATGPPLLPALVDAMAPVEPQLIDTDWDAAFAAARSLHSRPALVVLLTAQDEPEASRGFLASLPALAGSHVLVGTASDDDSARRAGLGIHRGRLPGRCRASVRSTTPTAWPPRSAARGPRPSRHPPTTCRRASPTAISRSRPSAASDDA